MVNNQIQWKFIVEKAPWWGGFWERMVGITKRCLKKTIGQSQIMFEEVRTIVVEIKGMLNNRPSIYIYIYMMMWRECHFRQLQRI